MSSKWNRMNRTNENVLRHVCFSQSMIFFNNLQKWHFVKCPVSVCCAIHARSRLSTVRRDCIKSSNQNFLKTDLTQHESDNVTTKIIKTKLRRETTLVRTTATRYQMKRNRHGETSFTKCMRLKSGVVEQRNQTKISPALHK